MCTMANSTALPSFRPIEPRNHFSSIQLSAHPSLLFLLSYTMSHSAFAQVESALRAIDCGNGCRGVACSLLAHCQLQIQAVQRIKGKRDVSMCPLCGDKVLLPRDAQTHWCFHCLNEFESHE